jgi:DNA-binding response OmpR family regulator
VGFLLVVDDGSPSVRRAGSLLQSRTDVIIVSPTRAPRHLQKGPDAIVMPVSLVGGDFWNCAYTAVRVAFGAVEDMERAFLLGVDDYLCCPWTQVELSVRVQRLLSSKGETLGQVIVIGNSTVVVSASQAVVWHYLARRPGRVVSRTVLAEIAGLPTEGGGRSRAVDMQIARLRRALGAYGNRIETVRGKGYRLNPDTVNISNLIVDK